MRWTVCATSIWIVPKFGLRAYLQTITRLAFFYSALPSRIVFDHRQLNFVIVKAEVRMCFEDSAARVNSCLPEFEAPGMGFFAAC
jgi:hypothetical protein